MFFLFLILLFTLHVTESENISIINKIIESQTKHHNGRIISIKDDIGEKISSFSTHGPLFQVFQNTSHTRSPNLQSNVYNKMLSDEMLSINKLKNHNINNNTRVPIFMKISAPTPTLEIKQKWPIIEFLSAINSDEQTEISNNVAGHRLKLKPDIQQKVKEKLLKNKVVGLRSISEDLNQEQNPLQHIPGRYCTCMNSNAFTTCSHKGTSKLCTHAYKYDFRHEPSLHTTYPAFYIPYQSYFLGATPDTIPKVTYYHPSIINELKVPKKKKFRYPTTTQFDEDLYYENNNDKAMKKIYDYLENEKDLDNIYKPKKGEVLINIDYDIKNKVTKKPEQVTVKGDNAFRDIMNDLDSVYNDCAMKKCYCSSSFLSTFKSFSFIPHIAFTIVFLLFNGF